MTTPRQEDFSTVLDRMTDWCLGRLRKEVLVNKVELFWGGGFSRIEIEAHSHQAIRQAREIYEGEQRERK